MSISHAPPSPPPSTSQQWPVAESLYTHPDGAHAAGVAVSFDRTPPTPVSFDELESVRLYRDFLAAPERYLRHL